MLLTRFTLKFPGLLEVTMTGSRGASGRVWALISDFRGRDLIPRVPTFRRDPGEVGDAEVSEVLQAFLEEEGSEGSCDFWNC